MAYDDSQQPDAPDQEADQVQSDVLEEDKVVSEFKTRFARARAHSNDWRKEARDLYDLRAGHQWDEDDLAQLKEKYQGSYPAVTFNVSDKYSDAVTGLQINNRQEIRYFPRQLGKVGVDDYATGVVKWCRDQCEAEDEETDVFSDAFWVGMGWVEHFYDDSEDQEGYIAQERRDPLEMYWDWMARKRNLADRRFQIRIKPMTPEEYREFFGVEAEASLEGATTDFAADDQSPQIIPIPHDYGTGQGGQSGTKPIYVADYQWWRSESKVTVQALFPGDMQPSVQEFTETEWAQIGPRLVALGVPHQASAPMVRRCYYRAWICGDRIMAPAGSTEKIKKLPCGFTYEAITGKRDRNTNTWYGMGRVVRDPQRWINKFFSSILYTLSVNAKGGLLAEEDAFEDQRAAERSWANPAAITFTAQGAISGGKIKDKPMAQYPQGMDRLMTFALEALPLTSGMNPELLGLAQRDQPGVLEAQRKQSAMAIIAWVFDAMRRYYKRSGKLMLSMIREYLSDGQLVRIVGQQGAQYVPLMKDRLVARYDVVVDESPTSTNMIERVWMILERMIPMALQAQIPVPPEVIDYSPLPTDLKEKWKQTLQPSPEQQQAQQQQAQLQQRAATAEIVKDESAAQLNQAKAQQTVVETQLKAQAAPIENALKQMEAIRAAADAGNAQAGGQ